MAHMIDETTGRAAIAFRNETPWHGLGQQLQAGADIDTWRKAAGLDWEVMRAPVMYRRPVFQGGFVIQQEHAVKNRDVLYRSDTGADLGVVSRTSYKVHQPAEIMEFFGAIAKAGNFDLETAGALSGGKRIWALAKVGEGANIIGQDEVLPYLLLATSFDGTMTTIARMTCVRVVCNNTITMALRQDATQNSDARIVTSLKVPHSSKFNPEFIRDQLGIVHGAFDQFLGEARTLAEIGVTDAKASTIVADVIGKFTASAKPGQVFDIKNTRGFKRVMGLFGGDAMGSDLTGGKNAWQLLNAFTQYVDHDRGRTTDTTLNQAWFGAGEVMKNEAKEQLLALA
jgi:phage/plasmid-like protein (TIGR03299 family)